MRAKLKENKKKKEKEIHQSHEHEPAVSAFRNLFLIKTKQRKVTGNILSQSNS